jgi:hypothetical protein
MDTTAIRRQAKRRIDQLSPERVRLADDLLAYLLDRESDEATEELLNIPGFVEAFERAKREEAAGLLTPLEKLRRKP